ncbi:hypothetical protein DKK71_01155 [Snodgrassella alvi]|nr:hypothetical protein DKK71_01155 [Snodgrassella alvi]
MIVKHNLCLNEAEKISALSVREKLPRLILIRFNLFWYLYGKQVLILFATIGSGCLKPVKADSDSLYFCW